MLATDRTRFRPSDTIDAWGIVRSRDGATVPQPVTLRISRGWGDEHDGLLVLAQVTAATDRAGAFVATIPISELPVGPYRIQLVVGGLAIASRWFEVDEIRKPSFTVSVSTDRHALLEGDPLEVSVAARFFDVTPVASLPVRFGGEELEGRRVTTGADGTGGHDGTTPAKAKVTVPASKSSSAWKDPLYSLSGVATYYSAGYTAMRLPRGTVVVICGAAACIERTINDYGPQDEARLIDLYKPDFFTVCGCAWYVGLADVTVRVYN